MAGQSTTYDADHTIECERLHRRLLQICVKVTVRRWSVHAAQTAAQINTMETSMNITVKKIALSNYGRVLRG
jgi:hypothetical protein